MAGLDNVAEAVERFQADTVAVLACPEMSGVRLRDLAWELEKTGTDLCVAPALLDVAGPRTTIRPVAGLPLLHMDHPEFTGAVGSSRRHSTALLRSGAAAAQPAVRDRGLDHPLLRRRPGVLPPGQGGPGRPTLYLV